MNIEILGSNAVIDNLKRSYPNLNLLGQNDFCFSVQETITLRRVNDDAGNVRVQILSQQDTDRLYDLLNESEGATTISIIDNGSTEGLERLIFNNDLIVRGLGLQGHCYSGDISDLPKDRVLRLKDMKNQTDLAEVVLRTSDIAVFNINAIRRGDQVGNKQANTTGLTIEEACLLSKYIGASDLIHDIFIVGIDLYNDPFEMIWSNLENLLWYMDEGFSLRNFEFSLDSKENLIFSVVPDTLNKEIEFVKSTQSGRWWVKVPTEDGEMHMACSKNDYERACQNEITERINKVLHLDQEFI